MQANGGCFNWAAIDREALLGANSVRRRNLNYSGHPAIGQTSNLNSQTGFRSNYLIPAPEILHVGRAPAASMIGQYRVRHQPLLLFRNVPSRLQKFQGAASL